MANKQDIDFTYTTLDKIFRISIGETADFSGLVGCILTSKSECQ